MNRKHRNEIERKPVSFFYDLQINCVVASWTFARDFVFPKMRRRAPRSKEYEHF